MSKEAAKGWYRVMWLNIVSAVCFILLLIGQFGSCMYEQGKKSVEKNHLEQTETKEKGSE